jgi:ABC-type sugar transport system ATPase subunit
MITISNISKSFGKLNVLDNINISIDDGGFFAILGPSGCGKTSLLKVIAGLIKPDSGKVLVNNVDITDTHPNKRNIGMVFQNFFVYPHLNVYENIRYPLKYTTTYSKNEINNRVEEIAKLMSISHLLNRKSYELSGGEQQRVALARAIAKSPFLFLLDEPLASLDYQLRIKIRSEIKKLHQELNQIASKAKTFIYVTHDQPEAGYLADKIAVMNNGRIIQVGTVDEIFSMPKSLFVAEFTHTHYNKFSVSTIEDNNKVAIVSEIGKLPVTNNATSSALKNNNKNNLTLFIGCQHIVYHDQANHHHSERSIKFNTKIIDSMSIAELKLFTLENGLKLVSLKSEYGIGDQVMVFADKKNLLLYAEEKLLGSIG